LQDTGLIVVSKYLPIYTKIEAKSYKYLPVLPSRIPLPQQLIALLPIGRRSFTYYQFIDELIVQAYDENISRMTVVIFD